MIFQICRQFLHNLQGKSKTPTELKCDVMDKNEMLGRLEGNSKKMTLRDLSIRLLALAYIFGDIETMKLMMDWLEGYPLFDPPLVREDLKFTFLGLASLTLSRQKRDQKCSKLGKASFQKAKEYAKLGRVIQKVKELDRIGSSDTILYPCVFEL